MATNPLRFLLDQRAPDKETEWLSALAPPQAPAPEGEPAGLAGSGAAMSVDSPSAREADAASVEAPLPRRPSRQEMLLSALQRPTREDGVKAALFDGLFGGTRYSDDLKARRNMFDQALIGAQAADAGSAERALESEASRGMQREQMELTQRGQDLTDKRAEDQRKLQELLLSQRLGATSGEKEKDRAAALARARLGRHHGGGAPQTPEDKAAAEDTRVGMEATYALRASSAMGREAPFTLDQAKAYFRGEEVPDLPPEAKQQLEMHRYTLSGMRTQDPKKYIATIADVSKQDSAALEGVGKTVEAQKWNVKDRDKVKTEIIKRNTAINAAIKAWKELKGPARDIIVKLGPGGNLADAGLSPEDQARAARLQSLANFDIKQQAGSAVTDAEWTRVATEIGLPDGISAFRSPAVMEGWLRQHDIMRRRLYDSASASYPKLFDEGVK